jgi:hypothetical protein
MHVHFQLFNCLQILPYIRFGPYKDHHQAVHKLHLFTSVGSICHHMQSGFIQSFMSFVYRLMMVLYGLKRM